MYEKDATFPYKDSCRHIMQSIDSKIISRIYGRGKGCVVTPGDFMDLGSRQAVDLALHRLAKKGTLRRLARGLYDYPRIDPALGLLSPTIDAIVKALKGRDKILLQPSGGYAANLLWTEAGRPCFYTLQIIIACDTRGSCHGKEG